ncbi:MAG: SRPBCC family protein [Bryobacterales bacterium]|nr:SRPBCC family protein [Bryobacterales bacterium]
MLKKVALALAILIGAILAYAATKPDTLRVERTATVNAPPEKVFALINDFNQWPAWSPWEKLDPNMTRTLGGAPSGKGATYAWQGNKDVGKGRMEILESTPTSQIKIQLDFLEPFEAHNITDFTLEPAGGGTKVIWSMHGPNNFVNKLMQVFMDMDAMIGKDFEAGLANMNAAAGK